MDALDTFFIVLLTIITLTGVGVTFLFYWVPKKFGYRKTGKILSLIVGTICSIGLLYIVIDFCFHDQLFTKGDAKALLAEQDIVLNDPFKITYNKTFSNLNESYHTFTLDISAKDKEHIIEQIRSSPNFKGMYEPKDQINFNTDRYTGQKQVQNCENDHNFKREYYQPMGKGYAPNHRIIIVLKNTNQLKFDDVED